MARALVSLLLTLVCACKTFASEPEISLAALLPQLADGDLIFQESRSRQSEAVQAATGSRYSHMALIFGTHTTKPYVIEAVSPVRRTPLHTFIARGNEHHFVVMRLRDGSRLAGAGSRLLLKSAQAFLGRNYDGTFDWSDERIYCSELVWKAYERALGVRIGEPQTFADLDLTGNKARALVRQRLGRMPDPHALIITPVRMLQAANLRPIFTGTLQDDASH